MHGKQGRYREVLTFRNKATVCALSIIIIFMPSISITVTWFKKVVTLTA